MSRGHARGSSRAGSRNVPRPRSSRALVDGSGSVRRRLAPRSNRPYLPRDRRQSRAETLRPLRSLPSFPPRPSFRSWRRSAVSTDLSTRPGHYPYDHDRSDKPAHHSIAVFVAYAFSSWRLRDPPQHSVRRSTWRLGASSSWYRVPYPSL